jgi:carbamoyltransferase
MNILGIYGGFDWDANKFWHPNRLNYTTWVHDAGATLFCSGKHIHSVSEERLTGIKYDGNYPINSIKQCLDIGGISEVDIDVVCIPTQCIEIFYEQLELGIVEKTIKRMFPNAKLEIYSHHLCHAASSVFTSNFNDGVIITLDGAGSLALDLHNRVFEHECNTIGYFDKSKKQFKLFVGDRLVNRFGDYYHRNSFKAYVTKQNIPEETWDDIIPESVDGKVMGLSSYGKASKIQRYKKSDKSWGGVPYVMFDLNDIDTSLSPEDLAATCQKTFESSMLDYIKMLSEMDYLKSNVCFAGGVFLNVLSNTNIIRTGIFDNVHIPPFTNDTGLNFGAAAYHAFKQGFDIEVPVNIALLGKKYSDEEIGLEINKHPVNATYYKQSDLVFKDVANKLHQNKIVAWFQNRSEAGPRALGARSILMSARKKEHKDILNTRVKHREYWRPFAGIILKEYVDEYFEDAFETPYMLYSLTVKEDKRGVIPAITHEDNSCRIQTITYEQNPEVTQLITEYQKLSGVPVILNTSFNDNGKPIVETPTHAIEAFLKMDIDYLVIGNYIVNKKDIK